MKAWTQNGHNLSDVVSAVQKAVRRGEEKEAMYWVLEMMPKYEVYLWRRLTVIAHEDIGIAYPPIFTTVQTMREQFFEFRAEGRDGTARLILANVVLTLCRAPKSRIADHFQRFMVEEWMTAPKRPIPDYALDHHTPGGRAKGRRDAAFWLKEGCILVPPGEVDDPYRETAEGHWLAGRTNAPTWGKRGVKPTQPQGQLGLFDGPSGDELE